MAWPLIRIDLDDQSRDFRRIALQPGFPVLDRLMANAHVLRSWLGRYVADAEWDGQTVRFLWRDEQDSSSPPTAVVAATLKDLRGPLRPEVEAIEAKLKQAAPKTPNERLLLGVMQQQLKQALGGETNLPGTFYKVRVGGRWKLVWCWGFDRRHAESRSHAICTNEACRLAYLADQGTRHQCPRCGEKRSSGRSRRVALMFAALLLLAGLGGYLLNGRIGSFGFSRGASVAGEVLDAVSGRPIPRAEIRLESDPQQRAESDPNGSFRLTFPSRSIERLQVTAPGYEPADWVPPTGRASIDGLKIKLRGAAEVSGLVVEESTDQPIPFPTIHAVKIGHQVIGDESGVFLLPGVPSGSLEFEVSADGYQTTRVSRELESGRSSDLLFSLVGAATVQGIVQDIVTKEPIAQASIRIGELPGDVLSDDNGKFEKRGVAGTVCRFEVAAPGYIAREFERPLVAAGETQIRFLLRPELTDLEVLVVDSSDAAVPAATLRFKDANPSVRRTGAGHFQVQGLRRGTHRAEIAAEGFPPRFVDLTSPTPTGEPARIVLSGGARLIGRIVDAVRQTPVPQAEVRLADGRWKTIADEQGRFEFNELPSGLLPLEVIGRGYRATRSEVKLETGERTVEIELRGATVVSGKVTSAFDQRPITGATVELDGSPASQFTDADGRFRFEDLAVGTVRIRVAADGYRPETVEADAQSDEETAIPVVLRGSASLVGRVVDVKSGQPIDRAEVLVGTEHRLTSNAQGEFTLENCPARSMHVKVSAEGFSTEEFDHDLAQSSEAPVVIRLKPLMKVNGLVVDARSEIPVADAKITLAGVGGAATSDAEGRFEFQAPDVESYEFTVAAGGYPQQSFVERPALADPASTTADRDKQASPTQPVPDSQPKGAGRPALIKLALRRDSETAAVNADPPLAATPADTQPKVDGQFGPEPRGAKDPQEVSFFGVRTKSPTVGFVVDCSGSMSGSRLERTKLELLKSVLNLHPKQMFYVAFYDDQAYPMFHKKQEPLSASPVNKVRTYKWMKTVNGGGGTNPVPALEITSRMGSKAMFLLSDGVFEPLPETLYQEFEKQKSHVNTIAFEDESGKRELEGIAARTGGMYRFVPPAPIPELLEVTLLTQLFDELLEQWLDPKTSTADAQDAHDALVEFCNGEDFGPGVNANETQRRQARTQWRRWWVEQKLTPAVAQQPDSRLKANLDQPNFWWRWASIEALAQKQEQNAGVFIPKVKDGETGVNQAARRALRKLAEDEDFGPNEDAGAQERAIAFDQWSEWWRRQRYIANLKTKPDDSLIHDFDSSDLKTRRAAVQAVAERNHFRRPDHLIQRLMDPDLQVRQSAYQALVKTSGKDFGPGDCSDKSRCESAAKEWKKWHGGKIETEAGQALRLAEKFAALNKPDIARKWYQKVIDKYPGTEAAAKAARQLPASAP